jgi:cytochrome c-type biogenesis protein CcsB
LTERAAVLAFSVALIAHTAGIGLRWYYSSHMPIGNMFGYSLILSWLIAAAFVALLMKFDISIAGAAVSPVIVVIFVISAFLPKEISKHLMPALQSYWFYIHIILAALSECAFLIAAGAGGYYLVKRGRTGGEFPEAEKVESLIIGSIRVGYPLFTVGALFAGALWAWKAWGRFWSWDPKETGALVVWLFYTLLLHQQRRGKWKGSLLALMSLIGFLIIILSFLGTLVLGGLHAYI